MDKLDKVLDKLAESSVTLAVMQKDVSQNTKDLAEHIRRTDLLEARVDNHESEIQKALAPIKWAQWTLALCVAITTVISAAKAIF